VRGARPLPPDVHDLATGNPDAELLPPLAPALAGIGTEHKLYGGAAKLDRLVELARAAFGADRVAGEIAIVGGALDGIERVLQTQLRPGDGVVVEDPSWPRIADLVTALGLVPVPVRVDARGLVPDELERALASGARGVISTPRGQNPSGAALDEERARDLRRVFSGYDVLLVEDDYLSVVAGAPYYSIHDGSGRWVLIRSLSKILGPDLRVAPMIGDALTIGRVEGRQLLGSGWVSHLLQQTAAGLWSSAPTKRLLVRAERVYAERRAALVAALAARGIDASGATGLGVWVPVVEEVPVVQELLVRGWAVSAGERYRFQTPPGIRITTTTLSTNEVDQLADAVREALAAGRVTYAG
jgi:DNA-binding transcriptional MocR family regulator